MAEGDSAHQETDVDAQRKRERRELVRVFLDDLLWFWLDIYFVWPVSHVSALWLGAARIAIDCYFTPFPFSLRTRVIGTISILVMARAAQTYLPPMETDTHWWLRPASEEKTPPDNPCARMVGGRPAFYIYLGNAVIPCPADISDAAVIRIMGTQLLGIGRGPNGMTISAIVFSDDGDTQAMIDHNEFTTNVGNELKIKRSPPNGLTVYGKWQAPRFAVDYVNSDAVRVTGTFVYKGSQVVVTDEKVWIDDPSTDNRDFGIWGNSCLFGAALRIGAIELGPKEAREGEMSDAGRPR
jgi:hypothetical protein